MSKKRKGRQPNLPQEVLDRAQAHVHTPKTHKPAVPDEDKIDLAAEYQYVGTDLQRVGLLSAFIIVALLLLRVIAG